MPIRTTKPEKGNKYYIPKAKGGISPCLDVTTQTDNNDVIDYDLPVLANCVGLAVGWFNENLGLNECKYLGNTNASNMITLAMKQGLEVSDVPQAGGCMVWSDGGYGHIECVTKVENDIAYNVSSGYALYVFENRKRKKDSGGKGNWGFKNTQWKYLGCILPPKETEKEETPTSITPKLTLEVCGKKYNISLDEVEGE